jgi:hypothetical protein
MATIDKLKEIKRRHSASLLQKPGVCGVDIDESAPGGPAITVHLDSDTKKVRSSLPKDLEGEPLRVQVTGPIRKQRVRREV